jgi:tetratricopeptide (TPR) repeat protein
MTWIVVLLVAAAVSALAWVGIQELRRMRRRQDRAGSSPAGGLEGVASLLGFDPAATELPGAWTGALGLAREAEVIRRAASGEDPWQFDRQMAREVLPRYLQAIRVLDRHLGNSPPDSDEVARIRAGYAVEVGLVLLHGVVNYQRRRQELNAGDLGRTVSLRDLARSVLAGVPEDLRTGEAWYNLGSACELGGRIAEARQAYLRARNLDPQGRLGGLADESVQAIDRGETMAFP